MAPVCGNIQTYRMEWNSYPTQYEEARCEGIPRMDGQGMISSAVVAGFGIVAPGTQIPHAVGIRVRRGDDD